MDGTPFLECLESPIAEDMAAIPGPSSIGRGGRPDKELPAGDDQLWRVSSDYRLQIAPDEEQLPPLPDPQVQRPVQRDAQRRLLRLLVRKQPCPTSQGTPEKGQFS